MKVTELIGFVLFSGIFFFFVFFSSQFIRNERTNSRTEAQQCIIDAPFHSGDIVKMKLFDHIGMVIRVRCQPEGIYDVRFSTITSSTKPHILGSGEPIDVSPMSIIRGIKEYELEAIQNEQN